MAIKMKQLMFEGVKTLREISIEAQTASQECVMSITKEIISHYQSAFSSRSAGFGVNGAAQLRINTPAKATVAQASLGRWKRTKGKNMSESNKRKKDASQANPVLHSTANLHI